MPISLPPRDKSGRAVPHDHAEIVDDDRIIRRISAEYIVSGAAPGTRRLSSMAFQPSREPNGGMSIDIEKLILERGHDPAAFVTTPRFMGSVVFQAATFRAEALQVGYDPLPENPCHGEVWGSFTKGLQRRLSKAAVWLVKFPGVEVSA